MAQNEKPAVPALVVLDDATLDLVTGGLDNATTKPGGTSLMDLADLQAYAQESMGSHSSTLSDAASRMQELSAKAGPTDIYANMALFQQMAQEMRNTARDSRANELDAQVSALKDAAQEIRNAAEERFKSAVASGAMQIAGGVVGIGGMSIKDMADHAALPAKTGADHPVLSGITGGAPGVIGSMIQAGHEPAGAGHDARKAELEASVNGSTVQHAEDLMQQMMDTIRDVRDKLASIEQSRLETNRGIARNI